MEKVLERFKAIGTVVASTITFALGGYDSVLALLIMLVVVDFISGVVYAIMKKNLNSTEMRNGIMRKIFTFLVIAVAYRVDICIMDINGAVPELFGVKVSIRTFFIIYSCIEECISLLENMANIGVPVPKWLRTVLLQVSDCTNKSAPREVISFVKKLFNINITGVGTIGGEDEKPEEENGDNDDTKQTVDTVDKE